MYERVTAAPLLEQRARRVKGKMYNCVQKSVLQSGRKDCQGGFSVYYTSKYNLLSITHNEEPLQFLHTDKEKLSKQSR